MFSDSPSFLMKVVLKITNYTCQYKYATSLSGDIAEKTQQQAINGQ